MDRWSGPLLGGRSQAELPGAGEQGSEGSLWGMRGGEGFYSQGRAPIQGRKRRLSGDWCPRAPCRHLIGRLGCRPASGTCLRHFSGACLNTPRHASTCPGMPQHAQPCPTFQKPLLIIVMYWPFYINNWPLWIIFSLDIKFHILGLHTSKILDCILENVLVIYLVIFLWIVKMFLF